MMPGRRQRQHGIALPAMVFMLVIVGLLLAAGLTLLTRSQHAQVLQLQVARANAAARSALDWGLWQVGDPEGALALPAGTLPPCFAATTLALPAPLAELQVQVSCSRDPETGAVDEGGLKLASYRLLAVVTAGSGAEAVRRQVEARSTVCRNPGGSAPRHAC